MKAPVPFNEAQRLEALRQYDILDTAPEPEFDDLTHLAAQICGTPMAVITLVDKDRQWFKFQVGLSATETSRDVSFCAHTILGNDLLLVPDASQDERFTDNPAVTSEAHIRFYAGVPLITPEGAAIGSLCVVDRVPRQLDAAQQDALRRLGRQAVVLLEARPDGKGEEKPSRQARRQLQQQQSTLAAQAAHQNAEELRASEMRYRRLFETAKDGILILDATSGKIEDVNPYLCRLLGHAAEDFIGRQLWDVKAFEGIAADKEAFRELQGKEYIRHDDLLVEDLLLATKEGPRVSVEVVSHAFMSGDKKIIQCNFRDITARRQIENALHKANDELELHVIERTDELAKANESLQFENKHHQMTLAALRHAANELQQANHELQSNEKRLLQGNRLFTDLTHLRACETGELETALQKITEAGSNVLGAERCSVWLYNQDHSMIRCLDLYETATQKHSQGFELTSQNFPAYFKALQTGQAIVADDARTHFATREFAESYLEPLGIFSMMDTAVIVGGQMTGVLCCERTASLRPWKVEDQTFARSAAAICSLALESCERARAEAEMRQAREEADAANLAKSEFLSRMSHELRTPLNAILGFGQILEKQALTPSAKESVGYILRGGRHLLGLINEVLDIARVEAGQMELSLESVDLADIIPEICALMQPLAAKHKVRLVETNWEPGRYCVLADRQRIKQVLINLLANAIKYNRHGGQVEVTCHFDANQRAFISVRDTGLGISPENLLKLFTPFERLDAAASNIEGTGLGLVLAHRMTKAMGGKLSVQSTPGQGTTFTIELAQAGCPSHQLLELPEAMDAVNAGEKSTRHYSVLCVEDNPSNLRLIEAIFEMRPDITLLAAVQGSIGLDLARQHQPDLILLDLNLPDMHGSEILSRLQQSDITKDIPVVVVSADATPSQMEKLLAVGAKAYLTKPLDVGQMLQTLDQFLP